MLEDVKNYDQWAEEHPSADPVTSLRDYTEYVQKSYFKAGQLDETAQQQLFEGVARRATRMRILKPESSEEENEAVWQKLTRKDHFDDDARFVRDLYAAGRNSDDPEARERAELLNRYFGMKAVHGESQQPRLLTIM